MLWKHKRTFRPAAFGVPKSFQTSCSEIAICPSKRKNVGGRRNESPVRASFRPSTPAGSLPNCPIKTPVTLLQVLSFPEYEGKYDNKLQR